MTTQNTRERTCKPGRYNKVVSRVFRRPTRTCIIICRYTGYEPAFHVACLVSISIFALHARQWKNVDHRSKVDEKATFTNHASPKCSHQSGSQRG